MPVLGSRPEQQLGTFRRFTSICKNNSLGIQMKMYKKQPKVQAKDRQGSKEMPKFDVRKEEILAIKKRFPTKIPIVVERYSKEYSLPPLDTTRFLVPQELTMSQFLVVLRNRLKMKSTQSIFLLVNNKSLISISLTFAEIYSNYAGPDGYLYITYTSQETFGCNEFLNRQS